MPDRLRIVVIIVVLIVWISNFIASLVLPGYESNESINAVFMVVVGGIVATNKRDKSDRDG